MPFFLKYYELYFSAIIMTNFMIGVTTVSSRQTTLSSGGLFEYFKSSVILFVAPSTAELRFCTSISSQNPSSFQLTYHGRKKLIGTIQRAKSRRCDENSESENGDSIVNTVLNQAENPFLRRGRELLKTKQKIQEIGTDKETNKTSGRQNSLNLLPPSATAKEGKKKAALPTKRTPLLHDENADQIHDWHSPRDAYTAMINELLSLKDLVDRLEVTGVLNLGNGLT
jgi:hypothetical protein